MIRYLALAEVLELHRAVIERWGGATGIQDLGALESALAQPRQSFSGQDLYPDITSKAAALCFFLGPHNLSLLIRHTPSPHTPDFEDRGLAGRMDQATVQMEVPGLWEFAIRRGRPIEPRWGY